MTGTQPLTAPRAPLQFTDSTSCRQWLEQLTLTNVQLTHQVLTAQLGILHDAPLAPLERLKILEALRDAVEFVQGESSKRYAGKALPLEAGELTVWGNVQALWREVGRNYELCLRAYREGDLPIAPHAALVTMRCIRTTGQAMSDHYRCYRQPPALMWQSLHELYSFAERHGLARVRVKDPFGQPEPETSCVETYARTLLLELANPYSLTARQLALVERWLERWATLLALSPQPPAGDAIPLLAVDLTRGEGVLFGGDVEAHAGVRYLELEQLSRMLRQTINLLKQGQTPAQLGLGDDARQPGCENLLMLIYVQWCRAGLARGEVRMVVEDAVHVCLGLATAHLQISGGRGARPPGELSARDKQDLDTYGYITRVESEATRGARAAQEVELEQWQSLNRSGAGFLCIQRPPYGKARVSHNQLLAVRRVGSRNFTLGMVQWVRMDEDGRLLCGVRLFPGLPQAISVRPSNFSPVGGGRYERALLLPEVPAPSTPTTLVMPAGWFQSGRFVEIFSERKQVAKLLNLLEKGSDFDRGTIVIV